MKKIVLSADNAPSIYLVSDGIADNLMEYIDTFGQWLYDPENDHGYWVEMPGGGKCVCFTEKEFIKWLDDFVNQQHEKCVLLETKEYDNLSEEERTYPCCNF